MRPRVVGRAEQLVDVGLPVADMDAPGRVAQLPGGLPHVVHPPDALLLLDRDASGVHLPPEPVRPLERLASPELDRGQTERDAREGDRQAGVQEHPADGVGDVPALDERELPDPVGGVPGEAELGRVAWSTRTVPGVTANRAVVAAKWPARMTPSSIRSLLKNR